MLMECVAAQEQPGLPSVLDVPKSEHGWVQLYIHQARTAVAVQCGQCLCQSGPSQSSLSMGQCVEDENPSLGS